jgi:hypothetical protein
MTTTLKTIAETTKYKKLAPFAPFATMWRTMMAVVVVPMRTQNNMAKLIIYEISYTFEGRGTCTVVAENEDEASDKFYDGDYDESTIKEQQEGFGIDTIDELPKGSNSAILTIAKLLNDIK